MEPSSWNRRLRQLAWLPIPILLCVMVVLWVADPSAVYEPPHLLMAINLLFSLPGALLVAYQAGRGFLLRGNPGLLGFGCGMLFWGSAGPVGGILVPYGPGVVVTAHNILIWLAAFCHVVGVIFLPWQRTAPRWPKLWLAGTCAGALTLGMVVVLESLSGGIPTFFIQGEGGTPLRQIVLGSAIAMFVLTAILLKGKPRGTLSGFQDWYALALLLIAVGLFGVMIQSAVGSALGWTGRIAQNLGSAYLLAAAVVGLRETRDRGHPLKIALGEAKQRFENLVNLAADGIVLHERISETARGNFLQVNPTLCALLGYTAQEMRGLTPLDILAPEDRERVAEDNWVMDRNGLLRHEKTLVARDGRRIPVEISTRQYSHQGRAMVISVIRDISERKRAEEALRENEQLKQAVLDAMTAHVAVLDRDGRIVAVNEPWRQFAVVNSSEAGRLAPNTGIGANYLNICRAARGESTEGAIEAHDGIEAVLAGRAKTFSLEYPCHSPQMKRWFSLTVTPLGAARGGAVVSHIDITALRELADQLRDERDRFTRIAATVPGVICSFRLRPDGGACFPYASPAIEDLYGLRPEELVESAAPLWAMIHPDDLGHIDAGIIASARTMTPWRDEFRVEHPTKGEIWVEGHSMPVHEPDGSILWHGYVQDITERKQAEQLLFATNERLKALMEALPVGVSFSDDVTCQRITGNRTLLAQFEMTPQDNVSATAPDAAAAGRRVRYFHHGRELRAGELPLQRAVAEHQVIPPMELEVRLPSGRVWFAEVTGAPLRDAKAQVIGGLAVVADITERQRAEAALRALLDEKEVLLREVHHRVKNNLAAIIDLLELQRESAVDPPTASRLAELRNRIKSMALIHEMLYQSGNLSRVDFHGYLQALAGHLRDSLDPRGAIRLRVTAPEIWMNLDTAIPCGLIVNELVTNALKYAFPQHRPRPGIDVCEIAVAADWDGATYTLTITDNGIGLPASLDWTTTRTLGLRLVRMLGQHQLGGQIELDGAGGTRFSLRFGPRSRQGSKL
jgi:PAS domain S-box-containing protein